MAKSKREKELARKLRAGGLRKRPAKLIAGASDGRRKPTKKVQRVVDDLGKVLSDHKDRVKGGSCQTEGRSEEGCEDPQAERRAPEQGCQEGGPDAGQVAHLVVWLVSSRTYRWQAARAVGGSSRCASRSRSARVNFHSNGLAICS